MHMRLLSRYQSTFLELSKRSILVQNHGQRLQLHEIANAFTMLIIRKTRAKFRRLALQGACVLQ
jgi:hypothetical protein